MRVVPLLVLSLAVPLASAHGDLEINELETLVIRDFEGQEDSFPWEGWEIWDVYVGEGYNETFESDGVYIKANFAGDGTQRPTGGSIWTLTFAFLVGEESFAREITHDGVDVATTFESLQWQIADGNVFQIKAWVPVSAWEGRSVSGVTIVSSVDGSPRDTAPGGVHDPATGREIPVSAPSTVIFPPMGEGRIVEEVPLTGPAKYLDLAIEPRGNDTFTLTVTNVLEAQGQHVILSADAAPGWELVASASVHNLEGKKSAIYDIQVIANADAGATLAPYTFEILTDVGGRRTLHAYLDETGAVTLTEDAGAARTSTIPDPARAIPGLGAIPVLLALATLALFLHKRHG